MVRDDPEAPLLCAVARAEQYGLFDLDRLERLVLRKIAADCFLLPGVKDDRENDDE